jgi:hypothetical protein
MVMFEQALHAIQFAPEAISALEKSLVDTTAFTDWQF